ncbi:polysaccharide deacetylase family protein [Pseudodesulfovibrio cashew]|uniref:Polysaccharide deacetylase family protein n=1 Tax=Pseudodesulfovibrio cashew TaxID=2678688 RepID=A0A6I6JPA0_9BACT|nr:polysaccharide deacetylase family protein [Pseudodesulfovibrio cashew]QGY39444.1 polysaccharide deacetylase family protein [Pseudodesulfovibrio cashew]
MIVKSTIASCWLAPPERLEAACAGMEAALDSARKGTKAFFRADDVAVPGDNCRRMLELFSRYQLPLHLAVTPAWLTRPRWETLKSWAGDDRLWCWHQHGWRHVNHQKYGKKSEFGSDRTRHEKRMDISRGRDRLRDIMGDDFCEVFTPPWNRFDEVTAEVLLELGFRNVSRSQGEGRKVKLSRRMHDTPVNVDLHTRGEADPGQGLDGLLEDIAEAVRYGRLGVMLHHQRMNEAAFTFLERCLAAVAANPAIEPHGPDETKVSIDQAIFAYSTSF